MSSDPSQSSSTYADLDQVPEGTVGELINGTLHVAPRPAPVHAYVQAEVGADLTMSFQRGQGGPGGWIILPEPELRIDGDAIVPDLAGWRRTTMDTLPLAAHIDIAPHWVCEIASPSTAGRDRVVKLPKYLAMGVEHVWLIMPEGRVIDVFRHAGDEWALVGSFTEEETARVPPFDAVPFDTRSWWPELA